MSARMDMALPESACEGCRHAAMCRFPRFVERGLKLFDEAVPMRGECVLAVVRCDKREPLETEPDGQG